MEEVPQPIRLARYRIDVALIDAASCGLLLAAAAAAVAASGANAELVPGAPPATTRPTRCG